MNSLDDVKYRHGASFLLAALGRRAERAWNGYLAERGVTTAQFAAVATLVEGERTQAQVAAAAAVDPRNMGATIKKLVEARWVRARPNPDDARSRLLSLTAEGRAWWDELQPELNRERDHFFAALRPQEFKTLESLLAKLEVAHLADSIHVSGGHV